MSSAGDVLRLRESLSGKLDEREPIPQRFRATMGDGTGAVVVPGKGNYVYVRRLGRGLIEECLNNKAAARDGLPIIAGYSHESPDVLQVLEVDWYSFSAPGAYPYTQHHHEAHELHNVVGGDDVVWVQSQQLMLLLVYPTNPASMRVNVFGGWYPWASGWHYFEPTLSADLTAHVPALAANARYVLISIDGATEALQYTAGATFSIFLPPVDAENRVPAPPAGSIPIGAVYLPNGTASLDWDNLYDMRLFNQPVGGSITPGVHALLDTTVHSDTATDAPTRGSLIAGNATPAWDELIIGTAHQILKVNAGATDPAWASFDWDEISAAIAADMVHDHSAAGEGGAVPVGSLGGYVRGSIIRGGAVDWEVYDAKTDKQILVGDGVDIASVPVTQDVALANTGAATVVGIQARTVAAAAPADGQVYAWNAGAAEWQVVNQSGGGGGSNPVFNADGVLVVTTEVDGGYVCPSDAEIIAVYLYCKTPGTAGSTIVDVNKNGVTIFTVQANRPTLAWNDPDGIAKSGVPDVVALVENDILTVDIDQVATAAADMTVLIAMVASAPVGINTIGARVYNSANINIPNAAFTALTFNSERFDTDDLHSVIANTSRLTCTKAGVYAIFGTVRFATNNNGQRVIRIRLNGVTTIAQARLANVVNNPDNMTISTLYELGVGDYVELGVYQDSGVGLNVEVAAQMSPEFGMVKAAKHSTGVSAPPNLYVAPNGNDANDGLSTGAPKATLQAAIDLVPDRYDRDVTIHVASGDLLESGITIVDKEPSGDSYRLLIRGYLNEANNLFVDAALHTGMATGATNLWPNGTSTLTDLGAAFGGVNAIKNRLLHITGGTGYDASVDELNWYIIDANTATTIDIAGRWNGATPDNTTTYDVLPLTTGTLIYGNSVNTAPVLTIYGCKNIVLRFMRISPGAGLGGGAGAAGIPGVVVNGHRMNSQPTAWGYPQYEPDLVWLGVMIGEPAVDSHGIQVFHGELAIYALMCSGWSTGGLFGERAVHVGRGEVLLRQFRIENWDQSGFHLVGARGTLIHGRIENNNEAVGFRAGVLVDAVSLLIHVEGSWIGDSRRGVYVLANSHAYMYRNNLITSNGGHGVMTEAGGHAELDGATNHVTNNGGWGTWCVHNASALCSGATYAGNASGNHSSDATSDDY